MKAVGKYPLQIIYLVFRDNSYEVWWEISTVDHLSGVIGIILMRSGGRYLL